MSCHVMPCHGNANTPCMCADCRQISYSCLTTVWRRRIARQSIQTTRTKRKPWWKMQGFLRWFLATSKWKEHGFDKISLSCVPIHNLICGYTQSRQGRSRCSRRLVLFREQTSSSLRSPNSTLAAALKMILLLMLSKLLCQKKTYFWCAVSSNC